MENIASDFLSVAHSISLVLLSDTQYKHLIFNQTPANFCEVSHTFKGRNLILKQYFQVFLTWK